MNFPGPVKVGDGGGCTRWRLSELLDYEATRNGVQQPELDPGRERYLTAREVAERYSASVSTIWRWALEAKRACKAEAA